MDDVVYVMSTATGALIAYTKEALFDGMGSLVNEVDRITIEKRSREAFVCFMVGGEQAMVRLRSPQTSNGEFKKWIEETKGEMQSAAEKAMAKPVLTNKVKSAIKSHPKQLTEKSPTKIVLDILRQTSEKNALTVIEIAEHGSIDRSSTSKTLYALVKSGRVLQTNGKRPHKFWMLEKKTPPGVQQNKTTDGELKNNLISCARMNYKKMRRSECSPVRGLPDCENCSINA